MAEEWELRLYCLVRTDIEIPVGKLTAQTGHAYCTVIFNAIRDGDRDQVQKYFDNDQPKITLRAKNLASIERAARECKEAGINHFVVTDAGRTVFNEPTVTCMGIGPVQKGELPKFVQRMQLYE